MSRLRDIPALQANNSNLRNVIDAIREAIQTFRGTRGDKLDTALTPRNVSDGTFDNIDLSGIGISPGGAIIVPGGSGGGSEPTPDLTPPPTPEDFAASAGLSFIAISVGIPAYTQGHGHNRTIVYGHKVLPGDPLPVFADAVELFSFQGSFGAYPSDPGTSWRLWSKWETNDGVLSGTPAGGTNGLAAATAQDPEVLLDLLEGEINFSHLFSDLSAPINSIYPGQDDAATAALRALLGLQDQADERSSDLLNLARDQGTALTEVRQVMNDGYAQLAQRVSLATAVAQDSAALVAGVQAAFAAADQALAASINTLAVSVGANTVALQEEATVRASVDDGLLAQYTVKADINGYVAGFGLASTANDATPFSEFGVRADRFYITPPTNFTQESTPTATAVGQIWRKPSTGAVKAWSGSSWIDFVVPVLFTVLTTRQVINGVTFEPGVYMDGAHIANLTATIANLGDAWITNAMVQNMSVDKLIAGSLSVGAYIQSTVYTPGSTGWKIGADGTVDFRGGTIAGITITASSLRSDDFVAGVSGWRLTPTGAQLPATNIIGKLVTDQLQVGSISSGETLTTGLTNSYTSWPNSAADIDVTTTPSVTRTVSDGWVNVLARVTLRCRVTSASVASVWASISLVQVNSGGAPTDYLDVATLAATPVALGTRSPGAGDSTGAERFALFELAMRYRFNGSAGTKRYRVIANVAALNSSGSVVAPGSSVSVPGGAVAPGVSLSAIVDIDERLV